MTYTTLQADAARRAIELNLPFALFALPGESEYHFYASAPDAAHGNILCHEHLGHEFFFATSFCEPMSMASVVLPRLSAGEVASLPPGTDPFQPTLILPHDLSTPFTYYAAQVHRAVCDIKKHKLEKVVLSRLIAEPARTHPVDIASEYFSRFPDTFRAMYFTQETGLWITATPELLLSDTAIGPTTESGQRNTTTPDSLPEDDLMPVSRFESMALAGTRSKSVTGQCGEEWDYKNTLEHDTVLDFITSTFRKNGLEPQVSEGRPVSFGDIEHKMHRITATGRCNSLHLVDELSPTPALAGMPLRRAIPFIAKSERHNRDCYGGMVGTVAGEELMAYVNIRCAMMANEPDDDGKRMVNIFAGGGIMGDSDYRAEWREAASKAMPLYRLVNPDNPEKIVGIPERWNDC